VRRREIASIDTQEAIRQIFGSAPNFPVFPPARIFRSGGAAGPIRQVASGQAPPMNIYVRLRAQYTPG